MDILDGGGSYLTTCLVKVASRLTYLRCVCVCACVCVLVFCVLYLLRGWSVVSKLANCVLTMCLPPLLCGVVKPGLIAVRNDAIKAESGHKKG